MIAYGNSSLTSALSRRRGRASDLPVSLQGVVRDHFLVSSQSTRTVCSYVYLLQAMLEKHP